MLPSLGFQEILLLAVLALVVIGPKDLPLMARKIGRFMAKLRGMAQEFRSGFDELARQAELDELKKEVEALRNNSTLRDVNRELTRPINLNGDLPPTPPVPALPAPEGEPVMEAAAKSEAPPEDEAAKSSEALKHDQPAAAGAGGAA